MAGPGTRAWLIGIRGRGGAEFGVGPNVTPAGVALAVVPSRSDVRVSLLCGLNWRH